MSTTLDNLLRGRALILDPKHWTTGAYARHENGNPIGYDTPNACQWCTTCALRKILGVHLLEVLESDESVALEEEMDGNIAHFNDTMSHAAVIAAWDRAIESTP